MQEKIQEEILIESETKKGQSSKNRKRKRGEKNKKKEKVLKKVKKNSSNSSSSSSSSGSESDNGLFLSFFLSFLFSISSMFSLPFFSKKKKVGCIKNLLLTTSKATSLNLGNQGLKCKSQTWMG